MTCIDCRAARVVMLHQSQLVHGKRCEWDVCARCFVARELELAKQAHEPAAVPRSARRRA